MLQTSLLPFYPRHQIRFDAVKLNSNSTKEFRFRGAPAADMRFVFLIIGTSLRSDEINRSMSIMDVELLETKPQLRRICKATGRPSNTEYSSAWKVGGPDNHPVSLWHTNCLKLPLKPGAVYVLRISIRAGTEKEDVLLIPVLEGGGIAIES